jgi:cytochrome c oxidase subunit IV
MKLKSPSKKLLAFNWIILVVLHFAILGSAYLNLGFINTSLIAFLVLIQMLLIILFFMEAHYSAKLIRVVASAGFFWLLILFTLVASDYLTRGRH